jgi:hypothetical protein
MEKMQFIFFVPSNEELEGTLHPQKFGCTPKNEGKRVHVPPDEKTCGHADFNYVREIVCDEIEKNQSYFDILNTNFVISIFYAVIFWSKNLPV